MISIAKQYFVPLIVLAIALLATGCSDDSDRPSEPPPPSVTALNVEPPLSVLDIGSSERYRALATYSDGRVVDASNQVSWSLEFETGIVEAVQEPENSGQYYAVAVMAGEDNIVATLDGLTSKSAVAVVEAELVELVVSPKEADLLEGDELAFTAEGTYDDGHRQDLTEESNWASADDSVVAVSDAGLAEARSEGVTSVAASIDGLSDSALVDVQSEVELESVEVSPQDARLFLDGSQQFNAYAHYTDGSIQQVTENALWISFDTNVISQDNFKKGLFHANSVGDATITAEYGFKNQGITNVSVEEVVVTHIVVTPEDFSLEVGGTKRYFTEAVASNGRFYSVNQSSDQSYTVADSSVAYISNSPDNKGVLTAVGEGTTTVTSTFIYEGEEFTDQATLTVCQGESC